MHTQYDKLKHQLIHKEYVVTFPQCYCPGALRGWFVFSSIMGQDPQIFKLNLCEVSSAFKIQMSFQFEVTTTYYEISLLKERKSCAF